MPFNFTSNVQPQELVAAPLNLYVASVGAAAPAIDATPATGTWTLVGTNGYLDYDSTGLTVTHNQTVTSWTSVGSSAPVTAWRTDEQVEISVTLADTTAAQYALALNNVAVTTISATTGVAGEQDIPLLQGIPMTFFALLARGISPLNQSLNSQYWIPCVYQSANPAPVYKKGAPAELALTFAAILDPNGNGFGKFQQQSAAKV